MKFQFLPVALAFALFSSAAATQQSAPPPDAKSQSSYAACPMHHDHARMDEHTKMNERGEQGMGFSQTTTTHHFFFDTRWRRDSGRS